MKPRFEKIEWECPYELKTGRVCGKKHLVEWDNHFDSPRDPEDLYCPRHRGQGELAKSERESK